MNSQELEFNMFKKKDEVGVWLFNHITLIVLIYIFYQIYWSTL